MHKLLQDFKLKMLAMIKKEGWKFFQYNSGGILCIISPLTSHL